MPVSAGNHTNILLQSIPIITIGNKNMREITIGIDFPWQQCICMGVRNGAVG
jgi:hypothetical protein